MLTEHAYSSFRRWIHRDKNTLYETIRLAHEDRALWARSSGTYPPAGSDMLRIPFSFTLPSQLPPSFQYRGIGQSGTIRYALTAVGVRKGLLSLNKRHCHPLAVVPKDQLGKRLKADLAVHGWKTFSKEERIRKGLWGEYSKVTVEVRLAFCLTFLHAHLREHTRARSS